MKEQIAQLKELWKLENAASTTATENKIASFYSKNNLLIPNDLVVYFKLLNGTNEGYDEKFFQFYSFKQFKSVNEELKYWRGIPDYTNIVNTLNNHESFFIVADYFFHLFAYAIRLYQDESTKNEVLVICGDQYKRIANSFSEFIDLYLSESIELQL
ncbi:MAG: SMI1/KNR4 family protein [Ferruginibacter sp.]|nr:SMI1/KNR4 family protein [Cytophagales bacterium]